MRSAVIRQAISNQRKQEGWQLDVSSPLLNRCCLGVFQTKSKKVSKLKYLGIFCGCIMTWKHVNSVNIVTLSLSGQTSAFRSTSPSQTFFIVQSRHLSNVCSSFSFVVSQPPRCVSLFPLCPLLIHQMPQQGRDSCFCSFTWWKKEAERAVNQRSWPFCVGGAIFGGDALFYFSSLLPWVYSSFTSFEHP